MKHSPAVPASREQTDLTANYIYRLHKLNALEMLHAVKQYPSPVVCDRQHAAVW